jgi:MFS family permease
MLPRETVGRMLQPYRDVLSRPGALRFSAAALVARLPISMVGIGIVLALSAVYDSYGLAGRVSAAYLVAGAAFGPLLGRWVDRHGQARSMRPALLVSVLGMVGLIATTATRAPQPWLYATAAVTGAALVPFGSMVRARWTHTLGPDEHAVHTAFSLEAALDEVVFIVGPVLATLLATGVAPTAGLVVPAVATALGGAWFLAQRATEPPVVAHTTDQPSRSALRYSGMAALCLVFVTMGAIFGGNDVTVVAFADEAGHKGLAGPVLATFAGASLVGGLAYGARRWVSPLHVRFAVGMVALAVGTSLFALVTRLWVLPLVMLVAGLAIAPTLITGTGLVQQLVPPVRLTEGLGWMTTALIVGVSVGSWAAGATIDAHGARGGFVVVAVAAACGVVVTLASVRRLRPRRSAEDVDVAPPISSAT